MPDSFTDRLRTIQRDRQSAVCVGLDPDPSRMPSTAFPAPAETGAVLAFNRAIIDATAPAACAFKLNFAFYEALGPDGWRVLRETIAHIPDDVLIIADAKRGDIGNSASFYARSVFDELGCDAITVSPYMGRDSVLPFLGTPGRAAFVLARTSNPGAADVQERTVDGEPLYLHVARMVEAWDREANGTAGLVAGATDPNALAALRKACPRLPFLIPGVGAQGGDPATVMRAAATDDGLVLVNSSRGIIYASDGADYATAAGDATEALRNALRA